VNSIDHIPESEAQVEALIVADLAEFFRAVVEPRYMKVTSDGVQLTPSWWAERLGMLPHAIQMRVHRLRQSQNSDEVSATRAETERKATSHARSILKDPERRERVIRDLSDDEREEIVDTAIKVTAQEATAKAREHQTEPTLADTGPIHDRTEYEVDVLLVKVWRWARELRRLVETRGVWVAEDRFDEALQRAQETEAAIAEVRAAIEEAVNERSMTCSNISRSSASWRLTS